MGKMKSLSLTGIVGRNCKTFSTEASRHHINDIPSTPPLVKQLCTLELIKENKDNARRKCRKACRSAKCCYKDKEEECTKEQIEEQLYVQYEPCMILGITDEISKKERFEKKRRSRDRLINPKQNTNAPTSKKTI